MEERRNGRLTTDIRRRAEQEDTTDVRRREGMEDSQLI